MEMSRSGEEVWLVVRDAGGGFDVAEARRNGGLGLVSMRERIHLVQGRLYVESRPGEGTTIIVCVPVRADGGLSGGGTSSGREYVCRSRIETNALVARSFSDAASKKGVQKREVDQSFW